MNINTPFTKTLQLFTKVKLDDEFITEQTETSRSRPYTASNNILYTSFDNVKKGI